MNAIEWGGRLDPNRKVRIACLRAEAHADVSHRRSRARGSASTICRTPPSGSRPDDPIAHMDVREQKGIRPGGFGLLMVRQTVDELIYNEKRNEVVFVKYLAGRVETMIVREAGPGDRFRLALLPSLATRTPRAACTAAAGRSRHRPAAAPDRSRRRRSWSIGFAQFMPFSRL